MRGWTDVLFSVGNNSQVEFDALKGRDVFEFFRILTAHHKEVTKRGKSHTQSRL